LSLKLLVQSVLGDLGAVKLDKIAEALTVFRDLSARSITKALVGNLFREFPLTSTAEPWSDAGEV